MNARMCPRIFCPAASRKVDGVMRNYVNTAYTIPIRSAGAIPLIVDNPFNDEQFDEMVQLMDGLLLQGGCDINPNFYGQEPIGPNNYDNPRDETELRLLLHAIKNNIPVLAICRGMQLLNVVMGGTLHQDLMYVKAKIHNHSKNPDRGYLAHSVIVKERNELSQLFGNEFKVNSMHHQGIDRLGESLAVAAVAEDGLIEAIRHKHQKYCYGVQWHPEELALRDQGNWHLLFKGFVIEAQQAMIQRHEAALLV